MTPTARSLKLLRERGYLCAIVEHWNAYAKIRQDLFGFGDLLCLRAGEILLVQTTSGSNLAARISKIRSLSTFPTVLSAGINVVAHGWRKVGPRGKAKTWECREIPVLKEIAT